jgi:electron transfer flavoprotein alpha subunit
MADGPTTILVCGESPALVRDLVGAARRALHGRDGQVSAVIFGEAGEVDIRGADMQYVAPLPDVTPEFATGVVVAAVEACDPELVLLGATKPGLLIAPRVAERIDAGYCAWVIDFSPGSKGDGVTARSTLYSGVAIAETRFKPGPVVLAVVPGPPEAWEGEARSCQVATLDVSLPERVVAVIDSQPRPRGSARLEEAPVVVDVGQGFRQREDLALAQALADLLDGQIACSRPLACDRDWFPEWLGLSGRKVAPDLVLTLGISGAVQHMVGIRDAGFIASINNDENADIFSQADVGVVADIYAFVPALVEALKARGVRIVTGS